MIPEKLYIPTSTLNFNNIMSSESISPPSFYSRRGFGFKRFEKVEPNSLNNRTILYDKYPFFDINDKELENYPMVIEINTNSIKENTIQEQNGFFYSDETIYLNPFSTRIFFRNEQEKFSTLSKSEPSIEAKMIPLYANYMEIKREETNSFDCTKSEIKDSQIDFSKYISKDRIINKLKGFLYSYLLAANKSVSPDVVFLKKYIKKLQNLLSAIITSPDGQLTQQQHEQLNSLYKLINNKFSRLFLEPLLKEKSDKYHCDFYNLLQQENLFYTWLRQNNFVKYQIQPFNIPSKNKENALDNYIVNIKSELSNFECNQRKSKIEIDNLPKLQNNRIINIPEQKDFLTKLFNEYLKEAYNSEDFIQSRYEFAKSGGKIFKEELKDKWEGSPWQSYINSLLKNLNEYTPFDIKSAKNLTLESFAAFCQKGESEINKLEDYLISNEIGDFRIAFGLWGIIFGYANMPKTLSNELFLSEDWKYVNDVYKFFFKQIHGIVLEGQIEQEQQQTKQGFKETGTFSPSMNQIASEGKESNKSDREVLPKQLKNCNLKPNQIENIYGIYERNNFIIDDKFFSEIQKKVMGVGPAKIKKIRSYLGHTDVVQKKSKQEELGSISFPKPKIEKDFYEEINIWPYIEDLLPSDKKIRKQVKTDLTWFQKNYNETYQDAQKGNTKGYFFNKPKDNNSTISHFKQYLHNKLSGNQDWLIKIYTKVDINRIISELRELYKQ